MQAQPRQQALTNESWGTFPRLWAALKAAEENISQSMQMLPGQLVVEGSTSLVLRSMVPLIPAGSSYYTMKALSIKEKAATLGERVMHKLEYLTVSMNYSIQLSTVI